MNEPRNSCGEPGPVGIGSFVARTAGRQRWLRTLNIEHHKILVGADASMAPRFETAEALPCSRQPNGAWARSSANPLSEAAK